jgi:hypothetical protein
MAKIVEAQAHASVPRQALELPSEGVRLHRTATGRIEAEDVPVGSEDDASLIGPRFSPGPVRSEHGQRELIEGDLPFLVRLGVPKLDHPTVEAMFEGVANM